MKRGVTMNKPFTILITIIFVINVSSAGMVQGESTVFFSQQPDYVIITLPELEHAVASLKTWKEFLGYSVEIVTTSWISSNYQGRDVQEQIRAFLVDKYAQEGIEYVLIVGSRSSIPMRACHPIPQEYEDTVVETDYYYADLSGNWNADGDDYFGEYGDDEVDFLPEVFVGRIPSDSHDTVTRICQNIIKFEYDTSALKKNALLLGSIIYYENLEAFNWTYARSDGATLMEECRIDIFEPNGFSCVRMYEQEGIRPSTYEYEYPLTRSNVLSEWTKGYGIVNLLGHANNRVVTRFLWNHDDGDNIPEFEGGELTYVNLLLSRDSDDLTLDIPPIVFSSGCSQLHTSRNMGKDFIEDGAAVAFIGSTDLGLYNITRVWNDERDGGCFSLDYYFFDYLINHEQKCGNALFNSKVYFFNNFMFTHYNPDWIYRCYSTLYGFNLYGDPSMSLTHEITDTAPPAPHIERPRGYLYIFDKEVVPMPFDSTVILGSITMSISATDGETGIGKIELFVDDQLKNITHGNQHMWVWDEVVFGTHTIKVVAYDNAGNIASDEQNIWIFNL